MLLSILVVSRSHKLLNQLLCSIGHATNLNKENVEILCSWNGTKINESKIINRSGYNFKISQREKYHFATNVNSLANHASGEILLIINDDIILDDKSIDNGINTLTSENTIGIVTGNLRYRNGLIQHIGISFDIKSIPYHKFERIIKSNSKLISKNNQIISASSGALLFIKKTLFLEIGFSEEYEICGEDIELSLDVREKKDLKILFCPDVCGIHFSSETRKKQNEYGNSKNDLNRMKIRREEFIRNASKTQIIDELNDLEDQIFVLNKKELKRKIFKTLIKSMIKIFKLKKFKLLH